MAEAGVVYIVGAGPGDPELITVKGLARLRRADVVVYDRLVHARLVDAAPTSAHRIAVGKTPGHHPWPQRRINVLLIAEARRGRRVVRLKGGDPFVFGRGGEECVALADAGVRFEVVPGVTSAVAAAAYAGIPVTHRQHASGFAVVTGHTCEANCSALDWDALARVGTLVVLMGHRNLGAIVARLRALGRQPNTPVAVVSCGTTTEQVVIQGTLADIADRAREVPSPITIVIGEVADLSRRLAWFKPDKVRSDWDGPGVKQDIVA